MNKFLFYASARMFGEACLELYICRFTPEGKEQVYLIPRPASDPFYPSMLHLPGVRKIPTETGRQHLQRAIRELPEWMRGQDIEYVYSETYKAKRGTEFADIRRMRVPYYYDCPDFYDVNSIPKNTIEHHKKIIETMKDKGALK